jgi:hypothetical protein
VNLPRSFKVVCAAGDGVPLAGAWVTATLHMNDKTDFISFHGPAGADGTIEIRAEELLHWAKLNRAFAPGDYLDPEVDWTGRITVTPLTIDAARAAIKFHAIFKERLDYPPTFADDLRTLISTLKPLDGQPLTLELRNADPPKTGELIKLRRRPA